MNFEIYSDRAKGFIQAAHGIARARGDTEIQARVRRVTTKLGDAHPAAGMRPATGPS